MDNKIDRFHVHEVLDRAALLQLMLFEFLEEHPALELEELRLYYEKAEEALSMLYQEAGRVSTMSLRPGWLEKQNKKR